MAPRRPRVLVHLPEALRHLHGAPRSAHVDAGTLGEAIARLDEQCAGLAGRILDDQGRVRRHVAIFINQEPVDGADPSAIGLRDGDTIYIVPSVSGGTP